MKILTLIILMLISTEALSIVIITNPGENNFKFDVRLKVPNFPPKAELKIQDKVWGSETEKIKINTHTNPVKKITNFQEKTKLKISIKSNYTMNLKTSQSTYPMSHNNSVSTSSECTTESTCRKVTLEWNDLQTGGSFPLTTSPKKIHTPQNASASNNITPDFSDEKEKQYEIQINIEQKDNISLKPGSYKSQTIRLTFSQAV
jgi:hypothetical protein